MFYIRVVLLGVWMCICAFLGLLKSIFRWGDTNLGKEYARLFTKVAFKIARVEVEYQGLEHIEATQPCIYTLNHQSNFDMAVFGAIYPGDTVIIGKKQLIWVPVFGLFYKSAGNIMIDRSKTDKAKTSLSHVVEEIIRRKVCVWIFPEGTRNFGKKKLLPFKKGPFHMAIEAQVPVVALVASSLKELMNWEKKLMLGGKLKIRVLPPIFTTGMTDQDVTKLTGIVQEQMQTTFDELNSQININLDL
ncbi:MAG: 1-acyl-sn-glycerol-3-phosphate acyltransferase [Candidatus Sericytochromatia bacterium]|nr:1-acyl-sn-glycerol-3-phosphate acyltransferase [Candidatus Sericytochromatia bacterium]